LQKKDAIVAEKSSSSSVEAFASPVKEKKELDQHSS